MLGTGGYKARSSGLLEVKRVYKDSLHSAAFSVVSDKVLWASHSLF